MVTQATAWGGFQQIDRDSVVVNEDGTTDDLDPELTEAIQSELREAALRQPGRFPTTDPQLRAFLNEFMPDIGIASMEDMDTASLSELVEGIFD